MIEGLKPYPKYKDSGVPWLGEVPEHWEVLPNRAIFNEVKERGRPEAEMLSVTITRGVIPQKALLDNISKKDSSNPDKSAYKLVRSGDIVYNKMRAWQGALGTSSHEGIVSPAYIVQRPRGDAHSRYFHHLFRTPAFAKEAERWSYGITSDMWSLRPEDFRMIYACLPPVAEQAAIRRFLDDMQSRIARYLFAKKKLVELLNERKQVIIHRAVTRGLDAGGPFKSSGTPWLGEVPQHWGVRRIASLATEITNGWVGPTQGVPEVVGPPYIQSLHIKNGCIRFTKKYFVAAEWLNAHPKIRLREGDVLVVQTGDIGQVACVPPEFKGAGCHALIIIRTDTRIVSGTFLDLVLRSRYGYETLKSMQTGALHPHLNCTWVREIVVPVPPPKDQRAIVEYTNNAVMTSDRTIAAAEREAEFIRELHVRLISDVVTGKLDVREAAARLPDEEVAELPEIDDTAEEIDDADMEMIADDAEA
jgi:type I restriction enzyme S subunit